MLQTLERISGGSKREREFDVFEYERLKTDQLTEASERLNGAMENEFEYTYANGDFHFQGQPLRPIFEAGIRAAEEIVKIRPHFMVELQRRHIERQQLDEQIELIRNVDWQNPLVLVHISPTPDAVLKDGVDLNAYDLERKKIMIRITEPTLDGVKVTSMSLDGNDRIALQAVGDFFGVTISDDASSEDILGMHFLAEKSQFGGERPAKVLRERYDKAMHMQYGGDWYAGRQDSAVLNTLQKIQAYPELVEQHVDEIMRLKKRLGANFRFTPDYERATYNFLAAIEQAGKLGAVVGSIGDAGDMARAAGVTYAKSDCPTSALTAEQSLQQQGIGERHWHYGTCQACMETKMVGECSVCIDCENADNQGQDLMAIRQAALAKHAMQNIKGQEQAHQQRKSGRIELAGDLLSDGYVKKLYGDSAELRRRKEIGDEVFIVVHKQTGLVLNSNLKRNDFALSA